MKRDLTRYLKTLNEKELIKEVQKLYTKFDDVKKFYDLELSGNTEQLVKKCKAQIKKEYFPSRGYGQARSSVSRKVITDFKKVSIFQKDVIDLWLYRTEMMLEFTKAYGDIDLAFYNSLATSFASACELIEAEKLKDEYEIYCNELIEMSSDFGWGVYDDLLSIYNDYLG